MLSLFSEPGGLCVRLPIKATIALSDCLALLSDTAGVPRAGAARSGHVSLGTVPMLVQLLVHRDPRNGVYGSLPSVPDHCFRRTRVAGSGNPWPVRAQASFPGTGSDIVSCVTIPETLGSDVPFFVLREPWNRAYCSPAEKLVAFILPNVGHSLVSPGNAEPDAPLVTTRTGHYALELPPDRVTGD
jgi:hypothetical protein